MLADDLAHYLRYGSRARLMVWRELPIPRGRIDVYAASFFYRGERPQDLRVCEVKESRSDWLAGLDRGQFAKYMGLGRRHWVATRPGVVRAGELPEGWGLMEREREHWRTVVEAPLVDVEPTREFLMLLAEVSARRLERALVA